MTLLFISSPAFANDTSPPLFEASYSLYRDGTEVGELNRKLSKGSDGAYVYQSTNQTTGLVSLFYKLETTEESRWRVIENQLQTIEYNYHRLKNKKIRDIKTVFNWKTMQATNIENHTESIINLESGMFDKLNYQIEIMRALKKGKYPITYTIIDSNKIKTYNFEFLGNETIETPLGTFETLKFLIQKPGDKRKSIIWCSQKHHYLPIVVDTIEKDGVTTSAIINTFKERDF
tara:strand:- start:6422 stop:7117 length:696 start_codon:yes stop_codon:yes gene_type:complete